MFSSSEHNMKADKDHSQLLRKVATVLKQEHGILLTVKNAGQQPQATLLIKGRKFILPLIIRPTFAGNAAFFALMERRRELGNKPLLLITERLSPVMLERLKKVEIYAADAIGDLYVEGKDLYLWASGKKPTKESRTMGNRGRAFLPAGLKVLFALLTDKKLLAADYRTIAQRTGVSLGAIGPILNDLATGHFLVQDDTGRRLMNTAMLTERWITAFAERLRPTLLMGTYRPLKEPLNLKTLAFSKDIFLGNEAAAEHGEHLLKAGTITLYSKQDPIEIVKQLRLIPDPQGTVELLKPFWDMDWFAETPEYQKGIVPYFLIYADLIASGYDRNFTAARSIHEHYLAALVQ